MPLTAHLFKEVMDCRQGPLRSVLSTVGCLDEFRFDFINVSQFQKLTGVCRFVSSCCF